MREQPTYCIGLETLRILAGYGSVEVDGLTLIAASDFPEQEVKRMTTEKLEADIKEKELRIQQRKQSEYYGTQLSIRGIEYLRARCYYQSVEAGWYTDLDTGQPKERSIPEMLCLIHSEISEAMKGYRKDLQDDHLPNRKMLEVELADALIRIFDLAGYQKLDLAGALIEKLEYNQKRADHKLSARQATNGEKKYGL